MASGMCTRLVEQPPARALERGHSLLASRHDDLDDVQAIERRLEPMSKHPWKALPGQSQRQLRKHLVQRAGVTGGQRRQLVPLDPAPAVEGLPARQCVPGVAPGALLPHMVVEMSQVVAPAVYATQARLGRLTHCPRQGDVRVEVQSR